MDELKRIMQTTDYGSMRLNLKSVLDSRGVTRNKLAVSMGVRYEVVDRFYKGRTERLDLDVLAKICCALRCGVSDLLEYVPPED